MLISVKISKIVENVKQQIIVNKLSFNVLLMSFSRNKKKKTFSNES